MNLFQSYVLTTAQKAQILQLWNNEFPSTYNLKDVEAFDQYLKPLNDHHHQFILNDNNEICAWYLDFIRDDERWFTIIVNSQHHGLGLGSRIMRKAIDRNEELNGWAVAHSNFKKQNGLTYSSALGFYQKLGFKIHNEIRHEKTELDLVKITYRKSKT